MAVSRYGKGDLCGISVRGEEEGDEDKPFTHAGVMTSLKIDPGLTYEEQPICGSRLKGTEYITGMDITAEVEFKVAKSADWYGWFSWLMGTSSTGNVAAGLMNTPKSRTVAFKVANNSVDLLTNAYVDELQIRSEKIGAPLVFNAKIIAGGYEIGSSVSGASISSGTPLRCIDLVQWSLSDYGPLPAGAWTLTITQNLEKVAGANSDGITVASGGEPYLGAPTVVFELTVPARSRTFDQLKMSPPMGGIRFFIPLMGRMLTIEGGIIDSDATQRNQGTYDETIRVRATNVTIM